MIRQFGKIQNQLMSGPIPIGVSSGQFMLNKSKVEFIILKVEHKNFFPFEQTKSMETLLDIAHTVLIGLQIIHCQGYVYNALRPENIQVSRENKVKLMDFTKLKMFMNSSGEHLS